MEEKIFDIIIDLLKDKRINFNTERYDNSDNFELFIGSESGYIQVEYSKARDEDALCIQFYSECNNQGISLYNSSVEISEIVDVIAEIEQLIYAIKENNKVISKIKSYIDKIQEICDEHNLEIDDFITVEYDFD